VNPSLHFVSVPYFPFFFLFFFNSDFLGLCRICEPKGVKSLRSYIFFSFIFNAEEEDG